MAIIAEVDGILKEALEGRSITKAEAEFLLSFSESSLEASLTRSAANIVSRKRFQNSALLLGQIGVSMAPCEGDCSFCAHAKSHTTIEPLTLSVDEVTTRCEGFARGGAQGVLLMTMHQFDFDWFLDLCSTLRKSISPSLEILANVGDISLDQLRALRYAGVSGAYHVCRLREGTDTHITPKRRRETIEWILEAGMAWYNSCDPIGPEHTPHELAEQIWLGVELPCRQHAAMRRFPVPGSPLYQNGQITLVRLAQIVAVIALATSQQENMTSIAVHEPNIIGLMSGANAFYPEAGEPAGQNNIDNASEQAHKGFTSALWRQKSEATTADCREMLAAAGFAQLIVTPGEAPVILGT